MFSVLIIDAYSSRFKGITIRVLLANHQILFILYYNMLFESEAHFHLDDCEKKTKTKQMTAIQISDNSLELHQRQSHGEKMKLVKGFGIPNSE